MRTYKMNPQLMAIVKRAINEVTNEYFDGRINIYEDFDWDTDKITFSVNWAAIGDTKPEDAVKFANNIQTAAAIAEKLNSFQMVMTYENSKYFGHLIDTNKKEDEIAEIHRKMIKDVHDGLVDFSMLRDVMNFFQHLEEKYA